jgi:hypothetical protein
VKKAVEKRVNITLLRNIRGTWLVRSKTHENVAQKFISVVPFIFCKLNLCRSS